VVDPTGDGGERDGSFEDERLRVRCPRGAGEGAEENQQGQRGL
jgi:hypothetical protein